MHNTFVRILCITKPMRYTCSIHDQLQCVYPALHNTNLWELLLLLLPLEFTNLGHSIWIIQLHGVVRHPQGELG